MSKNNNSKTVLMLLLQKFLPDTRVEQEYHSLKKNGYRVIVLASEEGFDTSDFEIIRIKRLSKWENRLNLSLKFNPILIRRLVDEITKYGLNKIDLIHVHDLYWGFIGMGLKRYYNCPLIMDFHENYPAMVDDFRLDSQASDLSLKHIFVQSISGVSRLKKYEQRIVRACDGLIVVTEEALSRFPSNIHYKAAIVNNTKNPEVWKKLEFPSMADKIKLVYMGTVQHLRGVDTAVEGMRLLDKNKYELYVVGIIKNKPIYTLLEKIIEENDLSNVHLVEWLDNENRAFEYIKNSHIGIVPHKKTDLTETTVPHKLFMYMATGRPVLVSDVTPLKRIVEKTKCGSVFQAENPKEFALKVEQMSDYNLLLNYANNGRTASEQEFNWATDEKRLLELYNSCFEKKK